MPTPSGLLLAYRLDGEGGARALSPGEVAGWTPERGLLWIHLDPRDPSTAGWLVGWGQVPAEVISALLDVELNRPRVESTGREELLVVLRALDPLQPARTPPPAARLWCTPHLFVSLLHTHAAAVDHALDALEHGHGPRTTPELLLSLGRTSVRRFAVAAVKLDEAVAALEADWEERGTVNGDEVRGVAREAALLRRYLAPEQEVMLELGRLLPGGAAGGTSNRARSVSGEVAQVLDQLSAVQDRARLLQGGIQDQLAQRLNQRVYVLTLISAVMQPLSFITGLLGVNVGGIPARDNRFAFAVLCGLLLLLAAAQVLVLRRRLKWFD